MTDNPETTEGDPDKAPWYRQRGKVLAAVLVLFVAGTAIGLVAFNELKRPDDVSNPSVDFEEPETKPKPKKKVQKDKTVSWPTFRLNPQRTGYLPVKGIHPPFHRVWKYGDNPLLEFPPIVVNGRLYFVDNDGYAYALDADTGEKVWQRHIAELNASTPTYSAGRLFIVNMEPGQVLSLNARNGRQIWKKSLPCRSESSPVVIRKVVYFGCENGVLYALKARNGKEIWTTSVSGAIKGAPAYEGGTLFVGDYGGVVTAVRARNGAVKWQSDGLGSSFGRAGSFYSTPAVAYGRVYLGSNDGRVYSFDADTGELAWTHSTGGWVYSGPTVAKVPGTPPTVYIGSFDGNIYALDAKSGETRWTFDMGGRVIGSLSVIGRTVYAATFDGTTTYGIGARSGREVFEFHTGAYMPGISDGEKLYLVGYSSIHALLPVTKKQQRAIQRKEAARKKARMKARLRRARQAARRQARQKTRRQARLRTRRQARQKAQRQSRQARQARLRARRQARQARQSRLRARRQARGSRLSRRQARQRARAATGGGRNGQ